MLMRMGLVLVGLPLLAQDHASVTTLEFELRSTIPVHEVRAEIRVASGQVEIISDDRAELVVGSTSVRTPARIRITGPAEVTIVADEREPWLHLVRDGTRVNAETWGSRIGIEFGESGGQVTGSAARTRFK